MSSIFQSLNTARKALFANRLGIDVASHNIANVNTPGYSRQRVDLKTSIPLVKNFGVIGTGVEIGGVFRIRNQMLDTHYRDASHNYGKSSIREQMLYQVETVVQEPSDSSIGNLMDEFFTAFSELGTNPENMNLRNVVVQKASSLSQAFKTKTGRLRAMQQGLNNDTRNAVNQVNQITKQIAEINRQIGVTENEFTSSNDLRDRRDLLIDQLSEFVEVQVTEDSQGQVTVSMNGQMLVSQMQYRELSVTSEKDNDNKLKIVIKGSTDQKLDIKTGKLGGLLEMHNEEVTGLLDRLDTLARSLIEEVNAVHRKGQTLPVGTPPTTATGLDFFTGSDATTIAVSSVVNNNPAYIAASLDGSVGNGETAFAIANLHQQKLLNGGAESFSDFYNYTVTDLGTKIQLANTERQNQDLIRQQIVNQRESDSGVSLDEEMTNLIKFQRSLEASAKVIGVLDEMLQTIVNL
jgi:flagellar hook-associated protein 1 FlgK